MGMCRGGFSPFFVERHILFDLFEWSRLYTCVDEDSVDGAREVLEKFSGEAGGSKGERGRGSGAGRREIKLT